MRCACITSIDELRDYMLGWEEVRKRAGRSPFNSYELSVIWLRAFEHRYTPRVLIVEDKGEVLGVAPFAQSTTRVSRFPVRELCLIGGADGTLGYQGLGPFYDPARKDVLDRLLKGLMGMDWSILRASRMEVHPTVDRFLAGVKGVASASDQCQWPTQVITLEDGQDIDSNFGQETRRAMWKVRRRLDREVSTSFRRLNTVEEAERAARLYADMHLQRWNNKMRTSNFGDPVIAGLLVTWARTTMEMGIARIYELEIDGHVAGQSFKFKEGDRVWSRRLGMDDTFARYSPGKMVSWFAMEDLQAEGATRIDLGGGQEQYKYDMGAKDEPMHAIQAQKGLYDIALRTANLPPLREFEDRFGLRSRLIRSLQGRQADSFKAKANSTTISHWTRDPLPRPTSGDSLEMAL